MKPPPAAATAPASISATSALDGEVPTEKAATSPSNRSTAGERYTFRGSSGQPELGDVGDQDLAGGGGREVVQVAAGVDQQQVGRRRAALLAGVGAVAGRPRGRGARSPSSAMIRRTTFSETATGRAGSSPAAPRARCGAPAPRASSARTRR